MAYSTCWKKSTTKTKQTIIPYPAKVLLKNKGDIQDIASRQEILKEIHHIYINDMNQKPGSNLNKEWVKEKNKEFWEFYVKTL